MYSAIDFLDFSLWAGQSAAVCRETNKNVTIFASPPLAAVVVAAVFFLKHVKRHSKEINIVVTEACHGDGRYFLRDQSNKNHVITHGVSGVDWRFYKSLRPGPVFDISMKWGDVELAG
jgi:hypothetical protein